MCRLINTFCVILILSLNNEIVNRKFNSTVEGFKKFQLMSLTINHNGPETDINCKQLNSFLAGSVKLSTVSV